MTDADLSRWKTMVEEPSASELQQHEMDGRRL